MKLTVLTARFIMVNESGLNTGIVTHRGGVATLKKMMLIYALLIFAFWFIYFNTKQRTWTIEEPRVKA